MVEDESSGVTDDLDLNGIDTVDKMKKLKKQADDAVKSAKKTEEAREKQEAELQKMAENLLKYEEKERRAGMFKGGISPTAESEGVFNKRMIDQQNKSLIGQPKSYAVDQYGDPIDTQIGGKQPAQGSPPMQQMDEDRLKHLASVFHQNQKIQANANAIKNIQGKSASIQQNIEKISSLAKTGFGSSGGPLGVINKLGGLAGKGGLGKMMAMGGIYGAIAYAVFEIGKVLVETVTEMVMEQFRAGGVFDVRKMVKDEVSTIVSFEQMLDREQGIVFFSGDTSEVLRQGPPQNANTREMEYGHKQFMQMFNN